MLHLASGRMSIARVSIALLLRPGSRHFDLKPQERRIHPATMEFSNLACRVRFIGRQPNGKRIVMDARQKVIVSPPSQNQPSIAEGRPETIKQSVAKARAIEMVTIEELETDPHGTLRRHRRVAPVISRDKGGFIVLRAADVDQLLRDPRVRHAETEFAQMQGVTEGALFDLFRFSMATSNGVDHRRRRSLFTRTFAAQMITTMRPFINAAANSLIDAWQGDRQMDLVDAYAAKIPAHTISAMLGLPPDDIPHFTKLVYSVSRIFSFTFTPDQLGDIKAAAADLRDYVERLLDKRRSAPCNDVLSTFLAEAVAEGELSPIEIVMQVVTLIIGGTDTTRVAMASQVSLLLQHRAQWEAVVANPGLVRNAVAEALRFEPSVGSVGRVTLEDVAFGDRTVPAGQFLVLSLMSALHDETVYAQPDVFDIRRGDQRREHLVFGGCSHCCIGEALAWAELEEGLAVISTRIPHLRFADTPPRVRGHVGIRRIDPMLVQW
jgi:cytochrome P450